MPLLPADEYRKARGVVRRGTRANQPAANTTLNGTLYYVTDELTIERSTGAAWESFSPTGAWTDEAHAGGDYTGSGSMTWTVASGDQLVKAYTILGKTMVVSVVLTNTTVAGTPGAFLQIEIPAGFNANRTVQGMILYDDNGTVDIGTWTVLSADAHIYLGTKTGANWTASTDNTDIRFSALFELDY